jgi:hypothetical protein
MGPGIFWWKYAVRVSDLDKQVPEESCALLFPTEIPASPHYQEYQFKAHLSNCPFNGVKYTPTIVLRYLPEASSVEPLPNWRLPSTTSKRLCGPPHHLPNPV